MFLEGEGQDIGDLKRKRRPIERVLIGVGRTTQRIGWDEGHIILRMLKEYIGNYLYLLTN